MTLFRRGRRERPSTDPSPAPSDDDPAVLLGTLYTLNREINRQSGRLPGRSVVTARLITDIIREVVETSSVRALDVYALVSVKGIINDYLPTSLAKFLALPESQIHEPRPSGSTPTASLQEQLAALHDAAGAVLVAAQAQDADALLTQGNFLTTKFSRSDLDL
ncbi:MAG: hypothetical protein JWM76_975 [Pseudonocardiales bacterium]|nr:hypothetical protein [Pseudonocardiales bacterium]